MSTDTNLARVVRCGILEALSIKWITFMGEEKLYTVGDIFRLGLLKDFKGQPYKQKVSVARLVNGQAYKTVRTPWGLAKCLNQKQIDKINLAHTLK